PRWRPPRPRGAPTPRSAVGPTVGPEPLAAEPERSSRPRSGRPLPAVPTGVSGPARAGVMGPARAATGRHGCSGVARDDSARAGWGWDTASRWAGLDSCENFA